jgi:hypothetical protein
MQIRTVQDALFVLSKKDSIENREYLVAFNNSTKPIQTTVITATSSGGWKVLLGSSKLVVKNEKVTVTVPALSTLVLKANKKIDKTLVKVGKITAGMDFLSGYYEVKAAVTSQDLLRVTFYSRTAPDQGWVSLGTDTNAPYAVYVDPEEYLGKKVEIRAEAVNSKGAKYDLPSTTITVPAS